MGRYLEIKKNDLQPWFRFAAVDNAGNSIDLTGATFATTMRNEITGELKINRRTTGIAFTDTGESANSGKGHFEWISADTNVPGNYEFEIEVSPSSGGKFTLWKDQYGNPWKVSIIGDVDNV